jgi:hypothetical protein
LFRINQLNPLRAKRKKPKQKNHNAKARNCAVSTLYGHITQAKQCFSVFRAGQDEKPSLYHHSTPPETTVVTAGD